MKRARCPIAVIESCESLEQMHCAYRYAALWMRHHHLEKCKEVNRLIYGVATRKLQTMLRKGLMLVGCLAILMLQGCGEKERGQARFIKRSDAARLWCREGKSQAWHDGCYFGYMHGCSTDSCPEQQEELP